MKPPLHLVLLRPEIPPNTGNVIRLCANTGSRLHLVEPMGFVLDEARVRRAGLDYHDMAVVTVHPDLAAAREASHYMSQSDVELIDTPAPQRKPEPPPRKKKTQKKKARPRRSDAETRISLPFPEEEE